MLMRSRAATDTCVIWKRIASSDNVIKIMYNDFEGPGKIINSHNDHI